MKNLRTNQRGVAHLAVIFGVIVLAAVAFAGYKVMNHNNKKTNNTASAVVVPAKIKSKTDVQQATKALDSQSNSALDPSQLDADLNSLL